MNGTFYHIDGIVLDGDIKLVWPSEYLRTGAFAPFARLVVLCLLCLCVCVCGCVCAYVVTRRHVFEFDTPAGHTHTHTPSLIQSESTLGMMSVAEFRENEYIAAVSLMPNNPLVPRIQQVHRGHVCFDCFQ